MKVKNIFKTSGAPTGRSMATSVALHVLVLGVLILIPAQLLLRSEPPNKELDIVFYRPPEIAAKARAVSRPMPRGASEAGSPPGAPAPALKPKPNAPAGPDRSGPAGAFGFGFSAGAGAPGGDPASLAPRGIGRETARALAAISGGR